MGGCKTLSETNGCGQAVTVETQVPERDDCYRATQNRWIVAGQGTFRMATSYDAADRVTQLQYPGDNSDGLGEIVERSYNSVGQLDQVMSLMDGTPFIESGATISYYEGSAGSVAMRRVGHTDDNGIFYIVGDHLGSASVIIHQDGTPSAYQYYYPFGGNRGDLLSPLTTKRYIGQYHEAGLPGGEGLSYSGALV